MNRPERFAILREHLTEYGWRCGEHVAVHPLLGCHTLVSALALNGEAAALLAMVEIGLVQGSLGSGEPGTALC